MQPAPVPGSPASPLAGVYDPRGTVLSAFVRGLPDHLTAKGEAWLVASDLRELLGLRPPGALPAVVADAGLVLRDRLTAPSAAGDLPDDDPLTPLRRRETVALWRIGR